MSNYIGVKCPVCNKKFTQTDDIVVCPICGAPHHRECYARENACAFADDHINGKVWRASEPSHPDESGFNAQDNTGGDTVICNSCKAKNPKGTIFCLSCGARIGLNPSGFNPNSGGFRGGDPFMGFDPSVIVYGGLSPDEKIEGETARDLAVYIGENSAYYLPKFKKIAEAPYSISFNLAALVFGFFYFFYRKMNVIGGILLGIFVLTSIPSFLYMQAYPTQYMLDTLPVSVHPYIASLPDADMDMGKVTLYRQLLNATGSVNFILTIVVAIAANRFYFMKAISDVKAVREAQPEKHDEIAYSSELRAKGGVSKTAIIIVIAAYFVISMIPMLLMFSKYWEILQMGGAPPL